MTWLFFSEKRFSLQWRLLPKYDKKTESIGLCYIFKDKRGSSQQGRKTIKKPGQSRTLKEKDDIVK